ncbi:MAG: protein-tyrosine-phosphatase [Cytophagales bacterium]|nr:protein-tyrosine-phosphatase [Cytophagales bacterium]
MRHSVTAAVGEFDQIPAARKAALSALTRYVQQQVTAGRPVQLTFICTHNSRRSHLSQLWAQVAAYCYGVPGVAAYSGGTEATAFNPRAVRAVEAAGFRVEKTGAEPNPVYLVHYAEAQPPVRAFSKVYDAGGNPTADFGAVITCTHADENCPFIPGAVRISLPYEDPKAFDGTPEEAAQYAGRCRQIARELLYAFSRVNPTAS